MSEGRAMRSCLILLGMLVLPALVCASDISIERAVAAVDNGIIVVDADAELNFSADAIAALESGVRLVFTLDIRIRKPIRYFIDRTLFSTHHRYSLERHALSDQYILTDLITSDRRIQGSLAAAVDDLGRIRHVPVAERDAVDLPAESALHMRLRLDIESLPAPMIPIAYVSPGWYMSSGWFQWQAAL